MQLLTSTLEFDWKRPAPGMEQWEQDDPTPPTAAEPELNALVDS